MSTFDHKQSLDDMKTHLLGAIGGVFPIRDRSNKLEVRVSDLKVIDTLDSEDIAEQMRHRMEGRTWEMPVHGTVEVVDLETNKPLVSKRMTIAKLPKPTRHHSYIVGGAEKFIVNQWRLRPGPFVKPTSKPGRFEAQFQLAKGKSFDIQTDDAGALLVSLGSRKVPLYSLMHAHGYSDDELKKAWGDDTFAASRSKARGNIDRGVKSFLEGWSSKPIQGDLPTALKSALAESHMDAGIAEANLGVKSSQVSGDVLLAASKKLLDVTAGKTPADRIDSLQYKELWTATDQFKDRLQRSLPDIQRRVRSALSKETLRKKLEDGNAAVLREVVMPDLIQRPMYGVFSTSLGSLGKQTNPIAMLADRSMVTITGPGGIENPHAITESNTAIDPSHLGFLDPVFTPESEAGKNTHTTFGLRVHERRPIAKLYSLTEKKLVDVDAAKAAMSNVVLPDQVSWKNGHPIPVASNVRTSDSKGQIRDLPFKSADYVMPHAAQVFSVESNLVPFMGNNSAGRTTMSARHMTQAISIVGREAPLVQVEASPGQSFEKLIGSTFLAQKAPVDGKVIKVAPGMVTIKDGAGKTHNVSIYHHYPTNDPKGMLHSEPLVRVGDAVKSGQLLADHNFSKNGVLALGTNLRTAYLANGLNHEDGIVISESAQRKLQTEHLYKPAVFLRDESVVGKDAFLTSKGGVYEATRLSKIGNDGVIRVGQRVEHGDPLVLMLNHSPEVTTIDASINTKLGKQLRSRFTNGSLVWDSEYPGEVVGIARKNGTIEVHVRTTEPAQVGSKISTRHSAKGIVTAVLPDKDMPHDERGRHVEMLINPVSVPGRINPGQLLETAAAKIAEKTGKPYIIKNFKPGTDYLAQVQKELKQHGLTDTETLYDPKTGRKLGDVLVGPHYAFQLEHQIDKKTHVRSGGPSFPHLETPILKYDSDTKIPKGGGHHGAQSLGSLGLYAALASGIHANLSEMQTLKSDEPQARAAWEAITDGKVLPPPQMPWAARKFEVLLQGMGVNVKKDGNTVRLMPRTDAETRAISHGVITHASKALQARASGEAPVKGGIFDPEKTGGPGGFRWSHIELAEPMPHPIHARSIAVALDIKEADIPEILAGRKTLPNGGVGPKAFKDALAKIDVKKTLVELETKVKDPAVKGNKLDRLNSQLHALRVLDETNTHPKDAWTIQAVPVIPPAFRPFTTMEGGGIQNNPLNRLYRRLGSANEAHLRGEGVVPYKASLDTREGVYQELNNLFGTAPKSKKAMDLDIRGTKEDPNKRLPGIMHMITGDKPKDGFFQDKLTGKKQDYTARVTIVADPAFSTDEIGVPKKVAMELYRPFVARRLMTMGYTPEEAHLKVSRKDPAALRALEAEVASRPVLVKRDPVLHQYGLVGQNIKLTDSKAVKMSPLVLPPLGADIDGDQVALMLPLSPRAVEEVKRLTPSQRPLADASGEVFYTPANEAALSLYRMSIPRGKHGGTFESHLAAETAFVANKIDLNTPIHIKGVGETTLGRSRIANVVPDKYKSSILTDLSKPVDRKTQSTILHEIAKTRPNDFVSVADGLSRLGFQMAYESGHTVALKDIEPIRKERAEIIAKAEKDISKLKNHPDARTLTTERWLEATRELHAAQKARHAVAPTNVSDMAASGIKAKAEQFQGLVMAPMLVEDHAGQPSHIPITTSFAEGVDVGGYFLQAAGARRGVIQKTQSVAKPGYMSKLLMQVNMDQPVTMKDCGTHQGIALPISDRDVIDRHLAHDMTIGGTPLKAGMVVTPDLLAKAKEAKVDHLLVRSPLKCRAPRGVCSVCMGMHPSGQHYAVGENAGIISAQALGERAAQIMLKQTHGGGIVPTSTRTVDEFSHVQRLFNASQPTEADAAVAPSSSAIHKITRGNDGVWNIWMADKKRPLRSSHSPLPHVKAGYTPDKGEVLTAGHPNPHDLLSTKGLEAAQAYMAQRVGDIYAKEGVLRRHAELTVRNATGMVHIDDPGGHTNFVRGDYASKPMLDELNRIHGAKEPIKYTPKLVAIAKVPHYVSSDWMGKLQGENLAATLRKAVQQGQVSKLDGTHPIPGLVYGRHGAH